MRSLSTKIVTSVVSLIQDGIIQIYVSNRYVVSRSTVQRVFASLVKKNRYSTALKIENDMLVNEPIEDGYMRLIKMYEDRLQYPNFPENIQ